MRSVALCVVGSLAVVACKGEPKRRVPVAVSFDAAAAKPERLIVTRVAMKVVDPTSGPVREVFPRLLAQKLGQQLAASDLFTIEPEVPDRKFHGRRASLEVVVGYDVVQEGSAGGPAAIAMVEAAFQWENGATDIVPELNLLAERPLSAADSSNLDGVVAAHCERAVLEAGAGLIQKEKLRVGAPQELLAGLRSDDVDLRIWALQLAGERSVGAAYETVVQRYREAQDESERDAALGTLVALRDPRAVPVLIDDLDLQDYALVRRVLDAVAALGGEEAADFLEFVASGHPEKLIRAQATTALKRMRRLQASPPSSP